MSGEITEQKMVKIWTMEYQPFVMGGSVWQPIATEVLATGPFDVGKGYACYLVEAPFGKTYAVDSISGALVGNSLDDVRADVEQGDPAFMAEQIEGAKKQSARANLIPAADFWRKIERGVGSWVNGIVP